MTTQSTGTAETAPKKGGARVGVQKFGTFLSGMVMPNIPAFIAWGLITAFFIDVGWTPNEGLASIVVPTIHYLLPLLIANTGGRMIYETRGGVIATIATMGAIVAAPDTHMFIGAMILGPLAAWLMKRLDALWEGKIKPGFEMLVNMFSSGILGFLLAIFGYYAVGPAVVWITKVLGGGVNWLIETGFLPLTSIIIEPAKVFFLNNAINHGVLTPLGTEQAAEAGKSILFLLEANPGPGVGILLAFAIFGVGMAKASAPGAMIIQFFGGIHEIYFPYVLMKPMLVLAAVAGGATGVATNLIFGSGLRAPAAPGSIFAILLQTASDSYVGVILSVILSATVSFLVAGVILRASRKRDLAAEAAGENKLADAVQQNASNKGGTSRVGSLLGDAGATAQASGVATAVAPVHNIIFACDAGMGSSAMGASVLRNKLKKAGVEGVTVTNKAIANLVDGEAELIITHKDLTERAIGKTPSARHVSVDNFMSSPKYDEVVAEVSSQDAE
ncbi:PTS mannitol transporter subunit IICB [Lysinibacter cavernae]|uniref:PTS system mannitol-specific EIICB component n=1 Tax=Lysinibacter cavernae TaxID=1640652 RepID=A0A7X5TUA5_9MICO|nr:PTS mannitol transporter subunit IICB [Lysinibacter cavernae]NIH54188.1 PTS system mannitol-specific IIC component [Lysinibacter cavernae]